MSIQEGGASPIKAINVGGERFILNHDRSIDLAFKGRKEFNDIYKPVSKITKIPMNRIIELFQTYLPVSRKPAQEFLFPAGGSKDREELVKVLEGRLEQISETRIYTVKNTNLIHIFNNIVELVEQINQGSFSGAPKKKRTPLTENEIFSLIFEFSWYLLHPNMEMNDDWEAMVKKLDRISLDGLVREIAEEEKKQGVEPAKTPLNYFKNIDLKNVIRQPTKEKSMERIKQMILFPHSDEGKGMKKLLQNLMAILAMKKFIDGPEYRESLPVIKVEDLDRMKQQMPERLIQGGDVKEEKKEKDEISISLGKAMTPVFDYFKAMYDPIYDFIGSSIEEFEKLYPKMVRSQFITECLHLLYMCTHLPSTENGIARGIYHIKKADPLMKDWVSFMLSKTGKQIDSFPEVGDKDDFKGQLYKLPIFRITTFKKGALKSNMNSNTLPYVQFVMLGQNMIKKEDATFMKQEATIVKEYEKLQTFFKEGELYMVVSDSTLSSSTQTPMNLYVIDDSTIQLDKPVVDVVPSDLTSEKPPMLEQVMDLKETTFNNGEIILCILHLLKKQMPQ